MTVENLDGWHQIMHSGEEPMVETYRQAVLVGVVDGGGEDGRFRVCVAGETMPLGRSPHFTSGTYAGQSGPARALIVDNRPECENTGLARIIASEQGYGWWVPARF